MENQPLEIRLDLEGVTNALFALLNECQNVILFGLRVIDDQDSFPGKAFEELHINPIQIGDPPSDVESQKKIYRNWLLKKGFEDFAKGIKLALIEAYCFGSIVKKRNDLKLVKDFLAEIETLRKTANEQSLPGLLSKVRSVLTKPLSYEDQIISINNARNCLIHGNGLVTDRHTNSQNNTELIIKGNRFNFYFEKDGTKYPMKVGQTGPENAPLMMGSEAFSIDFKIGQQIEITLKDFNDFINTCLYFGIDLKECLIKP